MAEICEIVELNGKSRYLCYDTERGWLFPYRADDAPRNVLHEADPQRVTTMDEAIADYLARPPRPDAPLPGRPKLEPATIETFWWNEEGPDGKIRPSPVRLAKVPADFRASTGSLYPLAGRQAVVLLSERQVKRPAEGYKYYEYRMR